MKYKYLFFILLICIFINSCINTDIDNTISPTKNDTIKTENNNIPQISNDINENSQINQKTLSEMIYPEWIYLSENFWVDYRIYSPIDHDYNIKRLTADFIDSFTWEFSDIWRQEMEFQYNKCIKNMPEKYLEQFTEQQSYWEKYFSSNIFPEIAMYGDEKDLTLRYGYIREATLIQLDKIRSRTIEIMKVQIYMENIDIIEFNYKPFENE